MLEHALTKEGRYKSNALWLEFSPPWIVSCIRENFLFSFVVVPCNFVVSFFFFLEKDINVFLVQ